MGAKNDTDIGGTPVMGDKGPTAPVLTADELAALLRLDRKTVYAMIKRGEIPGVRRFGRAVRILRVTVLQWLAEGQGQAPRSRRRQ
jgi:excisionase family DNA binding protein